MSKRPNDLSTDSQWLKTQDNEEAVTYSADTDDIDNFDDTDMEGEDSIEEDIVDDDDDILDEHMLDSTSAATITKHPQANSPLAVSNGQSISAQHIVTEEQTGLRVDKLAAKVFTEFSRAQLQGWINEDKLLVDGISQKPKYRVKAGETLSLSATLEQHGEDLPENIPLDIIFEDETVLVINKPVGMVVHPGAGNWTGTLVNALLYHYPEQQHLPRAGLVHRIDKDTSGLLLIAKTKIAQLDLTNQLKDKSVYRHYQCVVAGSAESLMRHRHINEPIGRHRSMRTKMTVTDQGREAMTHLIKITALNDSYCLVDVKLETGRTHQIRVHLSHVGHPLVGDKVYGGRRQLRAGLTEAQRAAIIGFPRQALHAYTLGFVHPVSGENIEVTAPLPSDIETLITILQDKA